MPNKNYDKVEAQILKTTGAAATLMATVNAVDNRPGVRFDSVDAASVFMARELDAVKAKSYDKKYPRFNALNLFPVNSDANPGAESITYYTYDMEGFAKIIDNYSTDLPRADANGVPHSVPVKSLGVSYGYSNQEMRASRMAGKGLDARKAEAARFQIDNATNKIAWNGDPAHGLLGVLSTGQNIPIATITAGATSNKTKWIEKTADEVLADVTAMYAQVSRDTMDVERPDTLVLPTDVYTALSMKRVGDTEETVLGFIQKHAPYLKEIVSAAELNCTSVETNPYANAVAANGQGVAFLFTNDPDKLEINIPMAYTQNPAQPDGLEVKIPCESRVAGVIVFYPMSAIIGLGV